VTLFPGSYIAFNYCISRTFQQATVIAQLLEKLQEYNGLFIRHCKLNFVPERHLHHRVFIHSSAAVLPCFIHKVATVTLG